MKLFLKIFSELLLNFKKKLDQERYFIALTPMVRNKLQDSASLAQIYEQGNSVLSKDAAIAYALYRLNASPKMLSKSKQKIAVLEHQLTTAQRNKAELILKKFGR